MHILLLSAYHGGSHQAWAEGLARHSAHTVTLLTLPARFWKWRMHGGAVTLARRFTAAAQPVPDLILADDMVDLTTFLALTRPQTARVPVALYMHENQLTYPLPADGRSGPMRRQHGERDRHYVFINYASMLAADRIFFNSQYHLASWFDALPAYLRHFPEHRELASVARLRERAAVLPVGVDFGRFAPHRPAAPPDPAAPPLILWNQRWEYDKNPDAFFDALYRARDAGLPFRVALCGENFSRRPAAFDAAAERLGDRIIHRGYAAAAEYARLLWQADITISTAHHEFFGISIVEAMACRTLPLLPRRLSYPELLPPSAHAACLYDDDDGLDARLHRALTDADGRRRLASELAEAVNRFDWRALAPVYDAALTALVKG